MTWAENCLQNIYGFKFAFESQRFKQIKKMRKNSSIKIKQSSTFDSDLSKNIFSNFWSNFVSKINYLHENYTYASRGNFDSKIRFLTRNYDFEEILIRKPKFETKLRFCIKLANFDSKKEIWLEITILNKISKFGFEKITLTRKFDSGCKFNNSFKDLFLLNNLFRI